MTTRSDINPLRKSIAEWAKEQDPQDGLTTLGYGLSTVLGSTRRQDLVQLDTSNSPLNWARPLMIRNSSSLT